jgi:hypothetical protein
MGYVHDTHMSQWIPPNVLVASAGTWTLAVATNVWSYNRTAADASFTICVPIPILSNSVAFKGSKLLSVELMWLVATAAMDAVAEPLVYLNTLNVNGTLNTAAAVTTSIDTGHDTAAERLTLDEHRAKVTITTPLWCDNDQAYHVEMVCDAAATSVFKWFGAIANYVLRI